MTTWIEHVKKYKALHPNLSYKECLIQAKNTYKKKATGLPPRVPKKRIRLQKGDGFFGDLIDKVKSYFFPAKKLAPKYQTIYDKFKDKTITSARLRRAPVYSAVEKTLNLISQGTYEQAKKQAGYDKMFHLGIVLNIEGTQLLLEKNDRIEMTTSFSDNADTEYLDLGSVGKTLGEVFDKTLKAMGEFKMFSYNSLENNCQDFILAVLKANGINSPAAQAFVKQDADLLVKKMPKYVSKISQFATDSAAKFKEIFGLGHKRRRKLRKI